MNELEALRKMVEEHDYTGALQLIDEMDEMAKDDKINKVESFIVVLLIHLIKQQAEGRTTNSWQRSVNYALFGIEKANKRRNAGGYYLTSDEISDAIDDVFVFSLQEAAGEAFGGAFSVSQLTEKIDEAAIKQSALAMIANYKLPEKNGR